jgi:peptide/nickel transport system permease protein
LSDARQIIDNRPPKGARNDAQIHSLWLDAIIRLARRKLALASLVVIALFFLLAGFIYSAELFGWKIGPARWSEQVGKSYEPPGPRNILGTDIFGQSVLRKTLYATKISMTVAMLASFISIAIGFSLGALAGYFRGIIDVIIVWIYSTLSSVPYILLVLAFAVVLRDKTVFSHRLTGITAVYLAIGLTGWAGTCRLIRGEVIKLKNREYVLAAVSYGCSGRRIIFKHILPNVFHLVIIDFSLRFVSFIHSEVTLSFLGLGENMLPSWGAMINDARGELSRGVWWQMAAATAAVFLISLALNIFGDALRDSLEPVEIKGTFYFLNYFLLSSNRSQKVECPHIMADNSPLLSVKSLTRYFYTEKGVVKAVQDVSFAIEKGQTFALVGESGCGKTTVALSILSLLTAGQGKLISGEIMFEGSDILRLPRRRMQNIRGNRIAMIFQEPQSCLNPVYTVGDQVAEAIKIHQKKTGRQARSAAIEMLQEVGIDDAAHRFYDYPHQMSAGMQQRVMVAMAICCRPALLIADEPTSSLDIITQRQILDLLDRLKARDGISILLITHDLAVAAEHADVIAVMYASRIVEQADSRVFFSQPLHPYSRRMLACLRLQRAGPI